MQNNLDLLFESIVSWDSPSIANYMIGYAAEMWASDIHIEPWEVNVRTRFRVDWTLNFITEYPISLHESLIARLKIMAGLKTDEKRLPQDWVISTSLDNWMEVDLRVNTLPTIWWEKVCMRIQDKTKKIPTLDEMWIRWSGLTRLQWAIEKPNGIVLVTWPTWSWKTTTLYSALNILNQPWVNIMTVEDPVEYKLAGLSQCQIKQDIWFSFWVWLRAALRQDPDIIMLWEIRDKETVEIALRAAMTGHLVLSTLHTNSATKTINRLIDMWVKPFLIAWTINAIQAQRLVRKVCENCCEKYTPNEDVKNEILRELDWLPNTEWINIEQLKTWKMTLTRSVWCEECNNSWFKWRMWIYEVFESNREIEEIIISWWSELELLAEAKKSWFVTMAQDWLIKAIFWHTTVEEIFEITNE